MFAIVVAIAALLVCALLVTERLHERGDLFVAPAKRVLILSPYAACAVASIALLWGLSGPVAIAASGAFSTLGMVAGQSVH